MFDLALVKGRVSGPDTLRVKKGERVELRWSSDRPILLHLHGYDIERGYAAVAGDDVFRGELAGRFPVSEHTHGAAPPPRVVYLEVHP